MVARQFTGGYDQTPPPARPVGTIESVPFDKSIPYVSLIIFQTMLLQYRKEFLLKRDLPVMPGLILNISDRVLFTRHTYAERPVSGLPLKTRGLRKCLVHKLGRSALHQLDSLRHG